MCWRCRARGLNWPIFAVKRGKMSILESFPKFEDIRDLILLARREDMGGEGMDGDDVTSRLLVKEDAVGVGTATITASFGGVQATTLVTVTPAIAVRRSSPRASRALRASRSTPSGPKIRNVGNAWMSNCSATALPRRVGNSARNAAQSGAPLKIVLLSGGANLGSWG